MRPTDDDADRDEARFSGGAMIARADTDRWVLFMLRLLFGPLFIVHLAITVGEGAARVSLRS
jgi:hypothetical protein